MLHLFFWQINYYILYIKYTEVEGVHNKTVQKEQLHHYLLYGGDD